MKLSHDNSVQADISLDSKVKFIQFYFVSFFFIDMKFKLIDLSQTKNKIEVQV